MAEKSVRYKAFESFKQSENLAIFRYIQSSNLYKETALNSWANENIADAWLIAAARYYNRPIITLEKRRTLNTSQRAKDVKIPEVAEHFNVECPILFDVMCELNFDL